MVRCLIWRFGEIFKGKIAGKFKHKICIPMMLCIQTAKFRFCMPTPTESCFAKVNALQRYPPYGIGQVCICCKCALAYCIAILYKFLAPRPTLSTSVFLVNREEFEARLPYRVKCTCMTL